MNKHWLRCRYCRQSVRVKSSEDKNKLIDHLIRCDLQCSFAALYVRNDTRRNDVMLFKMSLGTTHSWQLHITDEQTLLAVVGQSMARFASYNAAIKELKQKIEAAHVAKNLEVNP